MFSQGMFTNSAYATPEQIARKREMIAALMPRFGQAKYIGEGIGQLAYGIGAGLSAKKLDQQEQEGRAGAQNRFASLFSGIQGRAQPGGFSVLGSMPADPNEALAADTMQALGKGGTMQPDAVVSGLVQRGMPEHIAQGFATNFKDESGFNTAAVGDNGNAFGLAQWNGPRKAALEQFAAERGKPASDMNVQLDFLMAELQGPEAAAWSKISGAPDAGTAAAAVLNHFERPAEEHRARREAQYTGGAPMAGPQGAAASVPIDALYGILSDPWQSPENKAIAQSMIQQQQQIMDPAYQLGLEKARLEIDQMKNPQSKPTDDMAEYKFAVSQGYQGTFQDYMVAMKKAGASTNNISVGGDGAPGLGKLSTDYGYVLDENGNPVIDQNTGLPKAAPIPGSPAAVEAEKAAKAIGTKGGNAATASDVVTTAANRAIEAANNRAFGTWGQGIVGSMIPQSDAAEVQRQVDVLRSNATIGSLQAMREASPTGGALGGVTESENKMLADKAGALDPSSPNFERDLADYTRTLLRTVHGQEAGDRIFAETWKGKMPEDATSAPKPSDGIAIGAVEDGWEYIGGDPAQPESWRKVQK